jgi:predicted transposase YdaD
MAHHDPAYKLLFSHPQMVRDLLVGFVREDWVAQLDCDSFEKVNGSYVSDDFRSRSSDLVWRVRWGDDWVYIYLLLEFQSKPDRFMAVRMLTYVGLLYQDLIQSNQLPAANPLPLVLPIVLYNGSDGWYAARDLASLMQAGPRALQPYLPQIRYLLIDEKQHAASEAAPADRNLVTALFRLENSRTIGEILAVLDPLIEWLPGADQPSLRHAFSVWLKDSIMPRVQGGPWREINDLKEMRSMLSETVQKWKMEFREEGLREGLLEGLREGLREGEVQLLLRQLQKRFGELAESVRPRVQQASREQLETWAERILDAPSIDALFADTRSSSL